MVLPTELINEFAKTVKDDTNTKTEKTVYGTAVKDDLGDIYVVFDGSDLLTPVLTAVEVTDGERVIVSLKNHTATVTGNISSPAARSGTVEDIGGNISNVTSEIKKLQELETTKADEEDLEYEITRIDELAVKLAAAEKQIATNKSGIATNKTNIATNAKSISDIKIDNENIWHVVKDLQSRMTALETRVTALDRKSTRLNSSHA